VWGKTFTKDQILDNEVDATHELVMTVDGKPSQDFENLKLADKQDIIIEYKIIGAPSTVVSTTQKTN
jgi:hypothetical protein